MEGEETDKTRQTIQAWFRLRVGGFVMQRTRAAMPHSARAEAALFRVEGRGDDSNNEKGVRVVNEVNEGDVNIVVNRDCEPQCRK